MGNEFYVPTSAFDTYGLSPSWLLEKAHQLHWDAAKTSLGAGRDALVDHDGNDVRLRVLVTTINGDLTAADASVPCRPLMVDLPTADNGWRSQIGFLFGSSSLHVELVTTFIRAAADDSQPDALSQLEDRYQARHDNKAARRTNLLQSLGDIERARVESGTVEASQTVDLNKMVPGRPGFVGVHTAMTEAERSALSSSAAHWTTRNRRVHYYSEPNPADTLDISMVLGTEIATFSSTNTYVVRCLARRRLDDEVIAVGEAIYAVR